MEQTTPYTYIGEEEFDKKIPLMPLSWGRLLFINAATMDLYSSYWLYKNWKTLNLPVWSHRHSPLLKLVGTCIPIIRAILLLQFFKELSADIEHQQSAPSSASQFTLFVVVHELVSMGSYYFVLTNEALDALIKSVILITLTSLILYPLHNLTWDHRKAKAEVNTRQHFVWWESLLIGVGMILWFLVILDYTFPDWLGPAV